jgi:hypothetical protein
MKLSRMTQPLSARRLGVWLARHWPRRPERMAALPGPHPGEAAAVGPVRRLSYRLQCGRFADAPAAARTITTLLHLEAAPGRVRLVYGNDRPAPYRLDRVAVAATAAFDRSGRPIGADGRPDETLWRAATFGGVDSLSVPAAGECGLPALAFSDWIDLDSPPARAGGALLLVAGFSSGVLRCAEGGRPARRIGRLHASFVSPGSAAGAVTRADRLFACFGVQYECAVAGVTVVGIGDSIMQSACSAGGVSGFGFRACAMISTPQRPVSYVNQGFPGRNTLLFCAAGRADIVALRPQIALIQTWSQNEPWTQAQADLAFARALDLAEVARRHGCVPLLVGPGPQFAPHPAEDVFRRSNVERLRAAAGDGFAVLDLDALWGSGATPNAYRPRFDSGDGAHPNDAACEAAARALAPMLLRMLGETAMRRTSRAGHH